jgi:hypothetical protein
MFVFHDIHARLLLAVRPARHPGKRYPGEIRPLREHDHVHREEVSSHGPGC